MTQKYSLPLSSSVFFPSSLPPRLSLSQMGTLYVAYLQPNNLLWALWHTGTHTHTHTHTHASPDARGIQQTGSNFQTGLVRLTTA